MLLFRGTRTARPEQTVRGAVSYTPSLFVASIYSARPGNVWSSAPAHFLSTSTVRAITLRDPRIFDMRDLGSYCSLSEVLKMIGYPENISEAEVRRIYNYMHNRILGKARGGEFEYKVYDIDDDYEEVNKSDVPLSFLFPETAISYVAREAFDFDPSLSTTSNVVADTFIFVDAPKVQKAIRHMGYDIIAYVDVFAGAQYAASDLFGMDEEEVMNQEGLWEDYDIEDDEVVVHESYRILEPGVISGVETMPVAEAVDMLRNG